MTIVFGMLGFLVFVFSCFTVGFGLAFKRFLGFVAVGFTIDVVWITVMILNANEVIVLHY